MCCVCCALHVYLYQYVLSTSPNPYSYTSILAILGVMHFGYVLSLATVQILKCLEYLASKVNALQRRKDALILRTTIVVSALYVFCLGFIALAPHLNWGFGNGLYFSIVTFTTVGLGDYAPHFKGTGTILARVLLILTLSFVLIIGLSLFASIIGAVGNIVSKMTGDTESDSSPFDDDEDGGHGSMNSMENPMELVRLSTSSLPSRPKRSSTAEIKTNEEQEVKDIENPRKNRSSTSSLPRRFKGVKRSSTAEIKTNEEQDVKNIENPRKNRSTSSLPKRSKARKLSTVETKTDNNKNRKEIFDDLALLTGATVISENLGDDLDLIDLSCLGNCVKAISTFRDTVFQIDDKQSVEVQDIIENIKGELLCESNSGKVIKLEKRLAMLSAKLAVVKVGGNSDVELNEKKDRVEDAICATKAAIKEGVVAGGGIALVSAAKKIKPENEAEILVLKALLYPCKTIMANAGIEYQNIDKKDFGVDVKNGKTVNMFKAGIIDPVLVTKSALKNAASVASTIMSTNCVMANIRR